MDDYIQRENLSSSCSSDPDNFSQQFFEYALNLMYGFNYSQYGGAGITLVSPA